MFGKQIKHSYSKRLFSLSSQKICWSKSHHMVQARSQPSPEERTRKGFQTSTVNAPKQSASGKRKQVDNLKPLDKAELHKSPSLPLVVSERMGRRMLYASSIPFTLFVVLFAALFVAKYQFDITFIPSLVAYSSLLLILCTMVALSYGIFSASWDVEQEGSFWGWQEFLTNVGRTMEGFKSNSSGKK